jgi:pyruvate formate lyase activating enzyme
MVLTSYGRSSGFCIDPIEKKPLNHFLPGTPVLSFGTAGCNLACKFCQNWDMSKSREIDTLADQALPNDLADKAVSLSCRSLAFTYNDPVIFLEYAIDVAQAAHDKGIKAVAVSAGYICQKPREVFFKYMDAANIDLKAFTESFYKKICGGSLQPVLETLKYLKEETNVWFEITNLIIPDENDSESEINDMCQWIVENLGCSIPIHFTAFHPDWKMQNHDHTPAQTLKKAREIALSYGIKFAYTGNIIDENGNSTWCHNCHKMLIKRRYYEILEWHITQNANNEATCSNCGTRVEGVFEANHGDWGTNRVPIKIMM